MPQLDVSLITTDAVTSPFSTGKHIGRYFDPFLVRLAAAFVPDMQACNFFGIALLLGQIRRLQGFRRYPK